MKKKLKIENHFSSGRTPKLYEDCSIYKGT